MDLEIIIGTYEEYLLGYQLNNKDDKLVLKQTFSDRSHVGSIKCVDSVGKYFASGGVDDRIYIYDMKSRKQSQILQHHNGTINDIAFSADGSHLFTVGEDGLLAAVRLGSWMVEATWPKAHNGHSLTHVSVHPSGKLALTLGTDLTLRTWNLVKGRLAFKTNLKTRPNLKTSPDCIAWSHEGNFFTVTGLRTLEIWDVKTAEVVRTEKFESKPICVCWISDSHVFTGLESGKIILVAVDDKEKIKEFDAHTARVKSIAYHANILATCSSSGDVATWNVENNEISKIDCVNIGCRPTCITIADTSKMEEKDHSSGDGKNKRKISSVPNDNNTTSPNSENDTTMSRKVKRKTINNLIVENKKRSNKK